MCACITVYKDPGRAGRLDSLVCLSFLFLLEEKPADSLVPNLISFSSNLKTPDNVLAPTLHLLLLLLLFFIRSHVQAEGGAGLTCCCYGNPPP